MLLIGHVGISALLGRFVNANMIYVAVGALLPDLIDKTLKLAAAAPAGRYIGHTLFIGMLVFAVVYAFTRSRKNAASAVFGIYLHLLEDLPYFIPWLYPFVNYAWPQVSLLSSFNIVNFVFELVGLVSLSIALNERYWKRGTVYAVAPAMQSGISRQNAGD